MGIINWEEELLPYEQAVEELVVKFKSLEKQFKSQQKHSPIERIEGRVKSIASLLDKANKRNIPLDKALDVLEDIAGIRITCKFVEDIEKAVDLIRQRDGVDLTILEEEDYITNTKSSGYRSYHITIEYKLITANGPKTVKCEVQIRTMAMNFWATIEHSLRYKYNENLPDILKERLQVCAEAAFKLDQEMTTIRDELLEAQKIKRTKEILVDEIVKNIHNLYFHAHVDKLNQYNEQFIQLYQEGDIDKLSDFNNKLETMATLYNVKYV